MKKVETKFFWDDYDPTVCEKGKLEYDSTHKEEVETSWEENKKQ